MQFRSSSRTVICFLFLAFFILACEQSSTSNSTLVDWVPQNTQFVLQLNDINETENALKNNPVLKHLAKTAPVLTKKMAALQRKEITPQLISLTKYGKEEKALSVVYKAVIDSSYLTLPQVTYSGETIYVQKNDSGSIFTAFIDGFTLHSDTKIVLENCIRNYKQKAKAIRNTRFYSITKTADVQAPVNMHLQGKGEKTFSEVFDSLPLFPSIGQSWATYDVTFTAEDVELDGLLQIVDSLGDPVGLLQNSTPKKSFVAQAVPNSMTAFLSLSLDNIQTLENKFKKWALFHNFPLSSTDLSSLKSVDEIALVEVAKENSLIFHLRDEESASANFLPDSKEYNYRDVSYYAHSLDRKITTLISGLGREIGVQWVAKLDDFLFFSETEAGLKTIIAAYKDEKTLGKNSRFQLFYEDALSDKSNLLWVVSTSKIKGRFPTNALWKNINTQKLPFLALQGIVEDNFLHLHFRFHKNEEEKTQQTVSNAALLSLDNPISSSPQWLKNHRTKEKDIVAQDQNNMLYLFSNTGKLFWKKQLSSKIQGEIQQVDLYKNGRLQMAFRTAERFYILDRNGKVVAPFNIKTKTTAPIQPLAVFDYDQRRDYRFVLAQGKTMEMLDGKGRKVKGFNFKQAKSPIVTTPKHIRIDSKDYIAVKEQNGTLHLLNRTGKSRVNIKESIALSDQAIHAYLKTFTTTDQAGNLIQIDTRGNVVKSDLGLEKGHSIATTTKSLVTLSSNILTIKGIPVTLPYGQYTAPKIFYLNNILYISVTDKEAEKVYLYLSDGSPVTGFPVYGNSAIDLVNADKDKALEFIVQSESKDLLIYEIK